ncbi:PhzF family phenazine biosynthesis protein [Rheinheimera sediminis]|uniref:PhzF family phenazine biosynthesis protein n=1 Tax=Rheinheimera sp. YQF-1 TaxID=2499626 RepID=UPI000FDA5F61|nr:PhzF family phenazine biosynthesis protein [Rheinheimera sp. YQF-1]RVT46204.1 PhzF family phenazine biosynthesis protein [Rheinheimera sp. YQF-1]
MKLPIYQVDAFTDQLFKGNYAAVVPLQQTITDELMQQIATENNLSETAFVLPLANDHYQIRWFSPVTEIDFCGHATLAAAFVLFAQSNSTTLRFSTLKVGDLVVSQQTDGWIQMDFPQRLASPVTAPDALMAGLSIAPALVLQSAQAYFAIYTDEEQVKQLVTNSHELKKLAPYDVVATAPGTEYDFVSRYFWPANGGDEDPVTGSIHAGLVPYWAEQLGKTQLMACQASARGGVLRCELAGERVLVSGQAKLYLQGEIFLA